MVDYVTLGVIVIIFIATLSKDIKFEKSCNKIEKRIEKLNEKKH